MSSASVSPSICSFLYLPLSHSLVCCYQVTVLIAIMVATIAISFSWEILLEEISACFGIVEAVCACYGIESKNDLLLQGPKGPSSRFGQVEGKPFPGASGQETSLSQSTSSSGVLFLSKLRFMSGSRFMHREPLSTENPQTLDPETLNLQDSDPCSNFAGFAVNMTWRLNH